MVMEKERGRRKRTERARKWREWALIMRFDSERTPPKSRERSWGVAMDGSVQKRDVASDEEDDDDEEEEGSGLGSRKVDFRKELFLLFSFFFTVIT